MRRKLAIRLIALELVFGMPGSTVEAAPYMARRSEVSSAVVSSPRSPSQPDRPSAGGPASPSITSGLGIGSDGEGGSATVAQFKPPVEDAISDALGFPVELSSRGSSALRTDYESSRHVQYKGIPIPIPEPASLVLLFTGLIGLFTGLVGLRARRQMLRRKMGWTDTNRVEPFLS